MRRSDLEKSLGRKVEKEEFDELNRLKRLCERKNKKLKWRTVEVDFPINGHLFKDHELDIGSPFICFGDLEDGGSFSEPAIAFHTGFYDDPETRFARPLEEVLEDWIDKFKAGSGEICNMDDDEERSEFELASALLDTFKQWRLKWPK